MTAGQAANTSCDLREGQEGGGNDKDVEKQPHETRRNERGGKRGDFESTHGLLFGDAEIKKDETQRLRQRNTHSGFVCVILK